MNIQFEALEYTAAGRFQPAFYRFVGNPEAGWEIVRNEKQWLTLGTGYKLLQNHLCGICATDLARRFLPFQLPQIIGHEIVAWDLADMQKAVVEINDTPHYRGEEASDPYSRAGLYTHTPGRMVIGIDRLPGGFGRFSLAPQKAVIPLESISDWCGVLVEPFAAAWHAVQVSQPQEGDRVAVLGPRRLGSLVVASLSAFRRKRNTAFEIAAVARHTDLLRLCRRIGSDVEIDLSSTDLDSLQDQFDIVFDTTGSEDGFVLALQMAKREVHLKSTTGRPTLGLTNLTALVVDELALLPFIPQNLSFTWRNENRLNQHIYAESARVLKTLDYQCVFQGTPNNALKYLYEKAGRRQFPHFDAAVASSLKEIDTLIRPGPSQETAMVRPRGAILFHGDPGGNPLLAFIQKGGCLRSSRCGDFQPALQVLRDFPDLAETLSHHLISHLFLAGELPEAFEYAMRKQSRKVVVRHL